MSTVVSAHKRPLSPSAAKCSSSVEKLVRAPRFKMEASNGDCGRNREIHSTGPLYQRTLLWAVESSRSVPILRDLLRSLANITRAMSVLFGATEHKTRDAYLESFAKIPLRYRSFFSTDGDTSYPDQVSNLYLDRDSDLVSLRVLLINPWTQPHRDSKDWNGGWAWLAVLGAISGGAFCITELQRRIPFPPRCHPGFEGRCVGTLDDEVERPGTLLPCTYMSFTMSFTSSSGLGLFLKAPRS
ncbi:MAG: hypothetical protein M1816_004789 [Peltula sp. TS41687]|nr:MAG: hypothetical protein M1816_004789 [Peltula sp. TS41687]